MIWDSDARFLKGHHPSHNTFSKMQTQGTTAKEPHTKKFRPKRAKQTDGKALILPRSNEPIKLNCKEKKKKCWKKKQDWKNSFPATGDNTIEGNKGDKKYYNYQQKGHFLRNYPEPPKN